MIGDKIFCFAIIFVMSMAYAGERGYAILVSDLSTQQGSYVFSEYRNNFVDRHANKSCWDARKGNRIVYAYYKKPVVGFNKSLMREVVSGKKKSIEKLRRKLREFSDDQLSYGFDGVLIISEDVSKIYAFGSKDGAVTINIPDRIMQPLDLEGFDAIVCEASSAFDHGFIP